MSDHYHNLSQIMFEYEKYLKAPTRRSTFMHQTLRPGMLAPVGLLPLLPLPSFTSAVSSSGGPLAHGQIMSNPSWEISPKSTDLKDSKGPLIDPYYSVFNHTDTDRPSVCTQLTCCGLHHTLTYFDHVLGVFEGSRYLLLDVADCSELLLHMAQKRKRFNPQNWKIQASR